MEHMPNETLPHNTSILLAGGDPASLQAVQDHLEEFQLQEITLAHEGNEVLRVEETASFDLILLVNLLNDLSPPKVVAALRAGGKNSKTPILFLHRPEDKPMADRTVSAGASAALSGPWGEKELHDAIEKIFGRRIVTRKEERERATRFLEQADAGIARLQTLRAEGNYLAGEAAFLSALEDQLLLLAQMYEAKGEKDRAQSILEHVEEKFPGLPGRKPGGAATPSSAPNPGGVAAVRLDAPILVAERVPEDLAECERALGEFQLTEYRVARDAVSVLREDETVRFSLIVLSSSLSDMNPVKTVAALRAGDQNVKTPILILHGPSDASLAAEAQAAGATAALAKPISVESLQAAIEKALGSHIVTRSEAKEHSAQYVEAVASVGEVLGALHAGKVLDGTEQPLLERMRELILSVQDLYLTQGQKRQVDAFLDEARKIFPGIREMWRRRTESYLERGNDALQKESFQAACAEFRSALGLNQEDLEALIGLGEACIGLGDHKKAREAFEQAVCSPATPNSPQVLNRLGIVACRHQYFDVAIGAYDRLLTIYQFDPKLFYNKSLVHVRQREFGKALPLLSRALTLDPEYMPAKALHKKVRVWMNQPPDAAAPAP